MCQTAAGVRRNTISFWMEILTLYLVLVFVLARCRNIAFFTKKMKNVSCEEDRLNGWNSTLQAAWYIRHVRWACLLCFVAFVLRIEKKGLLSCSVHVAHAISAFQTNLSTASSVHVQLICDRLCYWLYIWYDTVWLKVGTGPFCRHGPIFFYIQTFLAPLIG